MDFYASLQRIWHRQDSLVCVGLDPDFARLPEHLQALPQPYFEFCRQIVDATAAYVCAFKPQFAHFAASGREQELAAVIGYIKARYPQHVVILDAKRGDMGSTAEYYAVEAYERYGADAVTVNPYLGKDSITPYMRYPQKGIVVLCRTSNPGSNWLQQRSGDQPPLYQHVASAVADWNVGGQFMLVAGATYPEELGEIRNLVGNLPLLVPGIGAQGGDLAAVLKFGLDQQQTGLLISSSRNIIYAGSHQDYAIAAGAAAQHLQAEINMYRKTNKARHHE